MVLIFLCLGHLSNPGTCPWLYGISDTCHNFPLEYSRNWLKIHVLLRVQSFWPSKSTFIILTVHTATVPCEIRDKKQELKKTTTLECFIINLVFITNLSLYIMERNSECFPLQHILECVIW